MLKKIISSSWKYMIVAVITLLVILFCISVERKPLLADDNTEFAKAVVTEVSGEDLQTGADLAVGDSQEVTLRITSGTYKGRVEQAHSLNGYLYGADCKVGTKVIVQISPYNDNISVSVYNYDRELQIAFLMAAFLIVIWLVGGKKGINSIIALAFTVVMVVCMYVPMMYIGISPFIAAVVTVVITTVVTFLLIADLEMKSLAAMLGTLCGVVVSGVIALIFGKAAHITGYNVDDIENLVYVAQNSKLDIGGMLFSGILIASLGAVMDVAMSVSSSLQEIQINSPHISRKDMFRSGINIGRDMIGTMSNTLILAYVGGSLNLIMIIYAYSYQMHQILNLYSVAIEFMRGIAGTMGIILTVPFTSFVTAMLLTRHKKIKSDKKISAGVSAE
ncbi:MAG: YibE/F family protein [Lachnospira sp.]